MKTRNLRREIDMHDTVYIFSRTNAQALAFAAQHCIRTSKIVHVRNWEQLQGIEGIGKALLVLADTFYGCSQQDALRYSQTIEFAISRRFCIDIKST